MMPHASGMRKRCRGLPGTTSFTHLAYRSSPCPLVAPGRPPGVGGRRHQRRRAPCTDGHAFFHEGACRDHIRRLVIPHPAPRGVPPQGGRLPSACARCLVVLLAATACLAPSAPVRAQHPTPPGASAQGAATTRAADNASIRPFPFPFPAGAPFAPRRPLVATRWPDRETVNDRVAGRAAREAPGARALLGTDYDWRKAEAKLNALPQFMTTIDGVDIHFIHVRSRHPNALPLIMTHGWPGSVFELLKTVGPLTDPTAHGGRAEDAFDLVMPSMPGYGFSGKPTGTGWDPDRIARAWAELMKRLGYTRYVAQGGDWGSPVSSAMARQAPAGLLGIHINLPATVPPEVAAALRRRRARAGGTLREGTRGVRLARHVLQEGVQGLRRHDGHAAANGLG